MEKLIAEMKFAMENELSRANKKHPLFHSSHEAYGVIKEELEESKESLDSVENAFQDFWHSVKNNNFNKNQKTCLESVRDISLSAAAEMIQTAAMAQKAIDSMEK